MVTIEARKTERELLSSLVLVMTAEKSEALWSDPAGTSRYVKVHGPRARLRMVGQNHKTREGLQYSSMGLTTQDSGFGIYRRRGWEGLRPSLAHILDVVANHTRHHA